jgi:hypothetical protein
LFGQPYPFDKYIKFDESYTDYQKVFVVIRKISELFSGYHFGYLSTVEGWAVLYKVLCSNKNGGKVHGRKSQFKLDETMEPKNFSDLVYKVKLLLNGASQLRFALGEGQKRTYASLYYCLGVVPRESPKFRGYEGKNPQLESAVFTGSVHILQDKIIGEIDSKLSKLADGIMVRLIHIEAEEEGFPPHVVKAIMQMSERSALANTETQERGWRSVMISLCQNLNSDDIVVPFECRHRDTVDKEETDGDWVEFYRKKIIKHFWDSRTMVDVATTLKATPQYEKIKTLEQFMVAILPAGGKKKGKSSALNVFSLNIRQRIPTPRLMFVLLALVVTSVTNTDEMEALSKLVLSNGKLSKGKVFSPDVVANTLESDFPPLEVKVCFFVKCFQMCIIIIR